MTFFMFVSPLVFIECIFSIQLIRLVIVSLGSVASALYTQGGMDFRAGLVLVLTDVLM